MLGPECIHMYVTIVERLTACKWPCRCMSFRRTVNIVRQGFLCKKLGWLLNMAILITHRTEPMAPGEMRRHVFGLSRLA